MPSASLGARRAWNVESENRPQRGQFLPDLQAHSSAIGQKDGEKWTAAVDLQPTLSKSDGLLSLDRLAPVSPPPTTTLRQTVERPRPVRSAHTGLAAATAATPVLRLEDIHLSFGGVTALAGVDLSIAAGEIRAVIGPNGAGKSSLVNVISGLYRPDRGRVWIGGKDFAQVPTPKLARLGVARTFQNLALFKGLTVRDNIVMGRVDTVRSTFIEQWIGLGRARRERDDAQARTDEIMGFLGLHSVRERLAGTLPYGLQKRVELARALVARPQLLLLDEPMAGMTVTEKSEMAHFVRAARDQFGTTILLIEHDIGVVLALSDRVAVLDYGRKIADGTPAQVRDDPAVIDAYLGVAHAEEGL